MNDRAPRVVSLRDYDSVSFSRGRSKLVESLWLLVDVLLIRSRLPGHFHRRMFLRAFGARVGKRVIIKPGVHIKFPWRLSIGDDSWIGEDVWIDNLALVQVGANCCLSQGAYVCTGSHDWNSARFTLIVSPVTIEDDAWIAARAVVGPGVIVGSGAVLCLGSVATSRLDPWAIYQGVPAVRVNTRQII